MKLPKVYNLTLSNIMMNDDKENKMQKYEINEI